MQLGQLFAGVIEEGLRIYGAEPVAPTASRFADAAVAEPRSSASIGEPVVITGAALGLPGVDQVFDDANIGRILAGQQFIGARARRPLGPAWPTCTSPGSSRARPAAPASRPSTIRPR